MDDHHFNYIKNKLLKLLFKKKEHGCVILAFESWILVFHFIFLFNILCGSKNIFFGFLES
jgi:hypothetical protein